MSDQQLQQLQLAMAKMLPEKVRINHEGTACWIDRLIIQEPREVYDTEWLHVCWLVEQQLNDFNKKQFRNELVKICGIESSRDINCGISASWHQRAEALCKVWGVTP